MPEVRVPPPGEENPSYLAEHEVDSLHQGLALDSATRDHGRREGLLTSLYWMAVLGVVVVGLALISGISILMYHYLSPTGYHWLSDQQLRDLQTIATSGLGTAVVVEVVRRYVRRDRER